MLHSNPRNLTGMDSKGEEQGMGYLTYDLHNGAGGGRVFDQCYGFVGVPRTNDVQTVLSFASERGGRNLD